METTARPIGEFAAGAEFFVLARPVEGPLATWAVVRVPDAQRPDRFAQEIGFVLFESDPPEIPEEVRREIDRLSGERDRLEGERDRARDRAAEMERDAEAARSRIDALVTRLAEAERLAAERAERIATLEADLDKTRGALETARAEIADLEGHTAELSRDLREAEGALELAERDHIGEIAVLNNEHETTLAAETARLESARAEAIAALEADYEGHLSDLQTRLGAAETARAAAAEERKAARQAASEAARDFDRLKESIDTREATVEARFFEVARLSEVPEDRIAGARAYLALFPEGRFVADAEAEIARAEGIESGISGSEGEAWVQACSVDTAAAYRDFAANFPNSPRLAAAAARRAALDQSHTPAPPVEPVPPVPGSAVARAFAAAEAELAPLSRAHRAMIRRDLERGASVEAALSRPRLERLYRERLAPLAGRLCASLPERCCEP